MMKNSGILARLLGRAERPAPVVSALYANAIGQPLLVHPQMGEHLIGGYLHGAIDARPPLLTIGELAPAQTDPTTGVVTPGRSVGVLNISGALVNRLEGGMCDPGPVSYESMLGAYNELLADPAIETIVLRLETPGGMASGLFDLSDRIYQTRASNGGPKRIIGCIDDYAYSAGYGLSAACDEIWITRTGGAGSVGVIAYHYDQSGWDAKVGLKVTPVFSGAHKADMSPHAPLADDQRAWLQARMDTMRQMFAESVAKYRGMTTEAVLATEAQVYQGAEAVAIGFADRIGTFAELMQSLAEGKDGWQEIASDHGVWEVQSPDDTTKKILSANIPADLAAALMQPKSGVTAANVDARIAHASAVANIYFAAGLPDVAADYVTTNTPIDTVRAQLGNVLQGVKESAQVPAAESNESQAQSVFNRIIDANLRPDLAIALMQPKAGVTAADVDARIAHASAIANLCFAAGLPDVAADYVTANTPVDTARTQLIDLKATSKHELDTNHPTESKPTVSRLDVAGIYERRNQRHTP